MPSQTKLCSETINLSSFKVKLRCDHTIYKPRRLPIKNRCLTHLDLPCHHFIAQNRRGIRCQSNAKVRKDPKGPFWIQRLHSCCPAVDKWALQKQITWLKTREKKTTEVGCCVNQCRSGIASPYRPALASRVNHSTCQTLQSLPQPQRVFRTRKHCEYFCDLLCFYCFYDSTVTYSFCIVGMDARMFVCTWKHQH